MTRDDVQAWLDRYVDGLADRRPGGDRRALRRGRHLPLPRVRPGADPRAGRDRGRLARVEDLDAPGSWTAHYEPFAVEGDRAVAVGESHYFKPDGSPRTVYYNLWTLRFDGDGRCTEFVEYFNELPERLGGGG